MKNSFLSTKKFASQLTGSRIRCLPSQIFPNYLSLVQTPKRFGGTGSTYDMKDSDDWFSHMKDIDEANGGGHTEGDSDNLDDFMYSTEYAAQFSETLAKLYAKEKLKFPLDSKNDLLSKVIADIPVSSLSDSGKPQSPIIPVTLTGQQGVPSSSSGDFNLSFLKKDDYKISTQEYRDLVKDNPHGCVKIINYKGAHITLVSSYYDPIPVMNLWKIMTQARPELILMQIRPDQLLQKFR
jgi:hypothetical protein